MLDRPILILSSWASGSPIVAGFLGECGAYLCPPFAKSINPEQPLTYESEMFRGMVTATVNEYSFALKVEPVIFRNGFKSWFKQQVAKASDAGADRIVLNHPLSVFLLDEICAEVDPIFIVVTRRLERIEATRLKQNLQTSHGAEGARIIYDRIYHYLHEYEKSFIGISFREFAGSEDSRLRLLDYCGLDVQVTHARASFDKVFPVKR